MKLHVEQIFEEPTRLAYAEGVDDLNERLASGAHDYRFTEPLHPDVEVYRAGDDVVCEGDVRGTARATCARCAEEFALAIDVGIRAVFAPRPAEAPDDADLSDDDLGIAFFDGEEIDLTELFVEQTLLALPTVPVCTEACRGLCSRCGANLNTGPCGCAAISPDSPFAKLRTLGRES